jgi:hypothetical protein
MTPKLDDMKENSFEPPVLKEEINLRVIPKAGHYNPEVKKTEKIKMSLISGEDSEKLYLAHL